MMTEFTFSISISLTVLFSTANITTESSRETSAWWLKQTFRKVKAVHLSSSFPSGDSMSPVKQAFQISSTNSGAGIRYRHRSQKHIRKPTHTPLHLKYEHWCLKPPASSWSSWAAQLTAASLQWDSWFPPAWRRHGLKEMWCGPVDHTEDTTSEEYYENTNESFKRIKAALSEIWKWIKITNFFKDSSLS